MSPLGVKTLGGDTRQADWRQRNGVGIAVLCGVLVLGGVVLVGAPARGGPQAAHESAFRQQAPQRDLSAWIRAAESHQSATADAAVVDVAAWSETELAALLPLLSKTVPEERALIVARGLVLHTDIVIAYRTATGYSLPSYGRPAEILADGAFVEEGRSTYHLQFARELIARLPAGEDRRRVARWYYHATGALLQWWAAHVELDDHLSAARRVLGDDALLLLYEGTRHQIYAHPRARVYFETVKRRIEDRAALRQSRDFVAPAIPSIASSRAAAERAFRRAVRLAPETHEARVRLAHVLVDRGRYREALSEIARVPVEGSPGLLVYYASVIEGRAQRGLGEFIAAEQAFSRAIDLYPRSQVPRLALSEIAMARGGRAEALTHLESLPAEPDEPWWGLSRLHINVNEAMQALWNAVR